MSLAPSSLMPQATPRVKPGILGTGQTYKLNLGGIGDADSRVPKKIPGFLTVDMQDCPETDVVTDCADLSMFADGTVGEIYASNILEHWPHVKTVDVLKEWGRVLKRGGLLYISVPDMDAALRLYLKHGLTKWIINLLWGDQIHERAYHYINFTFATLAKDCSDAGFSDIVRLSEMPFGLNDASMHRDSVDLKPVSLNVKAIR